MFALHWCVVSCSTLLAGPALDQQPAAIEVVVDGQPVEAKAQRIRIPASHKAVGFRLGRVPGEAGEGTRRMRFKLDGVDNGWRQMASEMCLMVRFADAAGDQVEQRIFPVDGISAGWHGRIGNSTFTQ